MIGHLRKVAGVAVHAAANARWVVTTALVASLMALPATADADDAKRDLEHAIRSDDVAAVDAALDRGADPRATTERGTPMLTLAINLAANEIVERLLATSGVDAQGDFAPLIAAAETGRVAAIEKLAASRSRIDLARRGNFTPLHAAVAGGHVAAVSALLARGAHPNAIASGFGTPLMRAVWLNMHADREQIIRLLLAGGADPNAAAAETGMTALDQAVRRAELSMPEVVDELLAAGADANHVARDGKSPLLRAADVGDPAVLAALRKRGYSVEARHALPPPRRSRPDPTAAPLATARVEAAHSFFLYAAYNTSKEGQLVRVQFRGEGANGIALDSDGGARRAFKSTWIVRVPAGKRELALTLKNLQRGDAERNVEVWTTLIDEDGNATHNSHLNYRLLLIPTER